MISETGGEKKFKQTEMVCASERCNGTLLSHRYQKLIHWVKAYGRKINGENKSMHKPKILYI